MATCDAYKKQIKRINRTAGTCKNGKSAKDSRVDQDHTSLKKRL